MTIRGQARRAQRDVSCRQAPRTRSRCQRLVPALGAAFVLLGQSSAHAAELLWQQRAYGWGFTHAFDYEPPGDGWDTEVADDFVVPPGSRWSVEELVVAGVTADPRMEPGIAVSSFFPRTFDVSLHAAASDVMPAGESASPAVVADTLGWPTVQASPMQPPYPIVKFRRAAIRLRQPLVVPSGTWWLSVRANEEPRGSVGYPTARWFWANVPGTAAPAYYRNAGNLWRTDCTAWTRRTSCIDPLDSKTHGSPDQDFKLLGTRITAG